MFPRHTNKTDLVMDAPFAADDMRKERRLFNEGVAERVQAWIGMIRERRQHNKSLDDRGKCESERRGI
jgi:hypothetical protein